MSHLRVLISTGLAVLILVLASFAPVQSRDNITDPYQSWPTRTSTPGPTSTRLPGAPTSPAPAETPSITSTPPAGSPAPVITEPGILVSPTSTDQQPSLPGQALSPIPDLSLEIDACAIRPIAQVLDTINIRNGPGLNYEVIGTLRFGEKRPIVGRSAFAPWWLVQLSQNTEGWVLDSAVSITGYTGFVPVLELGSPDDGIPPPGGLWNPTPNPTCQVTPPGEDSPTTQLPAATGLTEVSATPAAIATSTAKVAAGSGTTPVPAEEVFPILDGSSGGIGVNLLLVLGALLLVAGTTLYLFQRRGKEQS